MHRLRLLFKIPGHHFKAKERLYISMKKIGFEVILIENPDSAKAVLQIIDAFVSSEVQIDCNAFGLAFTSHGKRNGQMATYRDKISVEQIINRVKIAKTLVGKPKLFIFQGKVLKISREQFYLMQPILAI